MSDILITEEMIRAGLDVYLSPGRYEPESDFIVRLFCAMVSASPSGAFSLLQKAEMSGGELRNIAISHDVWRPCDERLSDRPDLNK